MNTNELSSMAKSKDDMADRLITVLCDNMALLRLCTGTSNGMQSQDDAGLVFLSTDQFHITRIIAGIDSLFSFWITGGIFFHCLSSSSTI